jgi:hypothetical protein
MLAIRRLCSGLFWLYIHIICVSKATQTSPIRSVQEGYKRNFREMKKTEALDHQT